MVTTGRRGGHRKSIIAEEIGERLLEYLEINFSSNLSEMKAYLRDEFNINASVVTINKYLKNI